MGIRNSNRHLFRAIEHMIEGMPFWMVYKMECYAGHTIMESVAVDAAVSVLNAHIDHSTYLIKCECPYTIIDNTVQNDYRADVAIFNRLNKTCICVLEFKLSTNSNGGILYDIRKLSCLPNSISRIVVLLSQREKPKLFSQMLDKMGKAKRNVSLGNKCPPFSVIRSIWTQKSHTSKMFPNDKKRGKSTVFRAICIELH